MSELLIFRERGQLTTAMLRSAWCPLEAGDDGQEQRMPPPTLPTPEVVEVKRVDHLPRVGAMLRALDVQETRAALLPPHARPEVTVGACVAA
jgi:hypothetical protein